MNGQGVGLSFRGGECRRPFRVFGFVGVLPSEPEVTPSPRPIVTRLVHGVASCQGPVTAKCPSARWADSHLERRRTSKER